MSRIYRLWPGVLAAMMPAVLAAAQPAARLAAPVLDTVPIATPAPLQSTAAALAQDGAAVAERLDIPADEAARQLWLQEASIAPTQVIADRHAGRLAGIAIDHRPTFGIVLLLTGDAPVPDTAIDVGGTPVRVTFRTGARTSRTGLVQAIATYQRAIRASLVGPPGLGIDQRTGELVAVVAGLDVAREGHDRLRDRLAALTQVPVRLRVVSDPALDMASPATGTGVAGGGRMVGGEPGTTRRYLCTAGFAVTDGLRTAMTTAAHCPDDLAMRDDAGRWRPLAFLGQWGWGHQDVQLNAGADPLAPTFFADTARAVSRPVTGAAPRAGLRAGDVVCHRGERTGYSCSAVELTDFAPAGDLCAGPCRPTWTTVAGPMCKGGDSGSPVFLGTTAYGLVKGGSYRPDGSCAFYFFMSTDYLPTGWRLLTVPRVPGTVVSENRVPTAPIAPPLLTPAAPVP